MQGRGTFLVRDNLRVASNALVDRGVDAPYVRVVDEKFPGWDGGNFIQDAWYARDLTVVENNDFARVVVSETPNAGGSITVPAGEYYIEVSAPAYAVNEHQLRLADVTRTSFYQTAIMGESEFAANPNSWRDSAGFYMEVATASQSRAQVQGRFTVESETTLEVQHRCATSKGKDGFGRLVQFYTSAPDVNNVYTTVDMWQIRDDSDGTFYVGEEILDVVAPISARSGRYHTDFESMRTITSNSAPHVWRRTWTVPNAGTGDVTASVWVKRQKNTIPSGHMTIFSLGRGPYGAAGEDGLGMEIYDSTDSPHFTLYEAGGTNKKSWGLSAANEPALDEWFMFTATWDGTNAADCIKLYINDQLETSPVKTDDDDVTAIDQPIGSGGTEAPAAVGLWSSNFGRAQGLVYSVATWDKVLTKAEVVALYNYGRPEIFDLRVNQGNYTSAADLQDYWIPGKDNHNTGEPTVNPYTFGVGYNHVGGARAAVDTGNMEQSIVASGTPSDQQIGDIPGQD